MLIILRGISGSGKSTAAKQIANNENEVLSSDTFRKMLFGNAVNQGSSPVAFAMLLQVLETRMRQGLDTIVDATTLKYRDAKKYIDLAQKYGNPYMILSLNVPVEHAVQRVQQRSMEGGLYVPHTVIKTQAERYSNNTATFYKDEFFAEFTTTDSLLTYAKQKMEVQLQTNSRVIGLDEDLWLIGDVHACGDELEDLIFDIIRTSKRKPVIYCLGDIIDRGPKLEKTLRLVSKHCNLILGNHEMNFLEELHGKECRSLSRISTHNEYNTHYNVKALMDDVVNYDKPFFMVFSKQGTKDKVLASHSGIDWNLFNNNNSICRSDMCMRNNKLSKPTLNVLQVYGHLSWDYEHIATQLDDVHKTKSVNIDSHCYGGGKLTAFNPFTHEHLQVQAKQNYYPKD